MGFLIFLLLLFLIIKAYRNTKHVKINQIEIPIQHKQKDKRNTLRILHISDLHLENLSIAPEQLNQ